MKIPAIRFCIIVACGILLMPEPASARGFRNQGGRGHSWSIGRSHSAHGGTSVYSGPFYGPVINDWAAYVAQEDMKSGRTHARILAVQQSLSGQGFYRGPRDGVFNNDTRRAIQRFQGSDAMGVTGIIDATLIESLGLDSQLAPGSLR